MRLWKISDGVYGIRWRDADGNQRQRTIRGDRRHAQAIFDEIGAARTRARLARTGLIEAPAVPRASEPPAPPPTVAEVAATWLEARRVRRKPGTVRRYDEVLKGRILPRFGALPVCEVTEEGIQAWVAAMVDEGLSPRRVNFLLGRLKSVLRTKAARVARKVAGVEDPTVDVAPLEEPEVEIDPLSPDEIRAFLDACPAWWRPYFTVAFGTGARPGELAALKRGDLDLRAGQLRIRATRGRGEEGAPKTKSSRRDVDLLSPVRVALDAQLRQQAARRVRAGEGVPALEREYVFTGPQGGFINPNDLRDRIWYPSLRKAKLRARTIYQTRHTFASNALAAGEDPAWVARQLGHKGVKMLFERYARFIRDRAGHGRALTEHFGALTLRRSGDETVTRGIGKSQVGGSAGLGAEGGI